MHTKGQFSAKSVADLSMKLEGPIGRLAGHISKNWLTGIHLSDPAILSVFRDAGVGRQRHILAWSGEFAGKYLTGAVELYKVTGDEDLLAYLRWFVPELLKLQQDNGYLGVFDREHQLTGKTAPAGYDFDPNFQKEAYDTWDSWGHYHIMMGLMFWDELVGDAAAFQAVERIAELFLSKFYGPGQPRLVHTGSEEMNLSVIHAFALLYQKTGKEAYREFAEQIVDDFAVEPAGNYLNLALQGMDFYKMPKPRWESIHPIEGMTELYAATGREDLGKAVYDLWRSMTETDMHNTGGFSTWEQAKGNPYEEGPIESCCVIAHMALTADMLRLKGCSTTADMLEMITFNAGMGMHSPSGKWSTYDTPMEGYKRANYHSIVFQSRPGSPNLNCCSVNTARSLGLISKWAYLEEGDSICLNYYGPHTAAFRVKGQPVTVSMETGYPYDGKILLRIQVPEDVKVDLKLRIPFWTGHAEVLHSGVRRQAVPGTYHEVPQVADGEVIELDLELTDNIWAGDLRMAGKGSLFHGPLLLCADNTYDRNLDVLELPRMDPETLEVRPVADPMAAGMLFEASWQGGSARLCDFYSAGVHGSAYTSWLPMEGLQPMAYSDENPFRLSRCHPENRTEVPCDG